MHSLISPTEFQHKVLSWFDLSGRQHLPWQKNKTAYRIWISEIMLQQTQVATVIPYYERFMQRFPDVSSLAKAPQDEVLHLWTGLGYYTRARNLHRSAKMIQDLFAGEFPITVTELQLLPGVGRSTAGAISAIAFKQQAAILDGNVKRVLTRILGITQWPGAKKIIDSLWTMAEALTPVLRVDDYTQAMMDLGATVCIRGKKPNCEACPLETLCEARKLGVEKSIPASKPKKKLPVKQATFLVLQYQERVILQKRAPTGIWGGLWSFPELAEFVPLEKIEEYCRQLSYKNKEIRLGEPFRHTFSHFHLDILPAYIQVTHPSSKIMDSELQIWYNLSDSQSVGLPAPIKKLLRKLI